MNDDRQRVLPIDGLHNFRDVGGYPAGSTHTAWRKLFRSDAPHRLSERGELQFSGLGISKVIDLRDDRERQFAPTRLGTTEMVAKPIFQGVESVIRDPEMGLEGFYRTLVDNHAANFAEVIREISSDPDQRVLIHCTAGKDRTGLVVAFVLEAVGVARIQILDDYALTETLLSDGWATSQISAIEALGVPMTPALRRLLVASPVEALATTLEYLDEAYTSPTQYLLQHGLAEHDLERLRQFLLSP